MRVAPFRRHLFAQASRSIVASAVGLAAAVAVFGVEALPAAAVLVSVAAVIVAWDFARSRGGDRTGLDGAGAPPSESLSVEPVAVTVARAMRTAPLGVVLMLALVGLADVVFDDVDALAGVLSGALVALGWSRIARGLAIRRWEHRNRAQVVLAPKAFGTGDGVFVVRREGPD